MSMSILKTRALIKHYLVRVNTLAALAIMTFSYEEKTINTVMLVIHVQEMEVWTLIGQPVMICAWV